MAQAIFKNCSNDAYFIILIMFSRCKWQSIRKHLSLDKGSPQEVLLKVEYTLAIARFYSIQHCLLLYSLVPMHTDPATKVSERLLWSHVLTVQSMKLGIVLEFTIYTTQMHAILML